MPDFKCMFLFASTFVFGIVALNCMFSNIELETRLSKTEEALQTMQVQVDLLSKLVNTPRDVNDAAILKDALLDKGNMQETLVSEQTEDTHISLRHRRAAKNKNKNKKERKKKCKNCLPSVEFEGSGVGNTDTDDMSGLWSSAPWMANGKSGPFKYDKINDNGMVEIKKSGLYIVYAQITIKEQKIGGFHIKKRLANGGMKNLASCTCLPSDEESYYSCFTMKMVPLDKNESIFVQELHNRARGLYSSSASYFGAVRIGNST